MAALEKARMEKKEAFQQFSVEIMKIGRPPPSPWCGLQHGLGGEMLEKEEGSVDVHFQPSGGLKLDPA